MNIMDIIAHASVTTPEVPPVSIASKVLGAAKVINYFIAFIFAIMCIARLYKYFKEKNNILNSNVDDEVKNKNTR